MTDLDIIRRATVVTLRPDFRGKCWVASYECRGHVALVPTPHGLGARGQDVAAGLREAGVSCLIVW